MKTHLRGICEESRTLCGMRQMNDPRLVLAETHEEATCKTCSTLGVPRVVVRESWHDNPDEISWGNAYSLWQGLLGERDPLFAFTDLAARPCGSASCYWYNYWRDAERRQDLHHWIPDGSLARALARQELPRARDHDKGLQRTARLIGESESEEAKAAVFLAAWSFDRMDRRGQFSFFGLHEACLGAVRRLLPEGDLWAHPERNVSPNTREGYRRMEPVDMAGALLLAAFDALLASQRHTLVRIRITDPEPGSGELIWKP